jgi:hypothetical protein
MNIATLFPGDFPAAWAALEFRADYSGRPSNCNAA